MRARLQSTTLPELVDIARRVISEYRWAVMVSGAPPRHGDRLLDAVARGVPGRDAQGHIRGAEIKHCQVPVLFKGVEDDAVASGARPYRGPSAVRALAHSHAVAGDQADGRLAERGPLATLVCGSPGGSANEGVTAAAASATPAVNVADKRMCLIGSAPLPARRVPFI
ncbi:hypothetical protein SSP24_03950 [Streptomyces spinoverrucosus]|uniref:Uncharacterized protein n=1 Tax=Streptomyces spinoverrucosus TaxID=284043 RepID=A0A4Y3VAC1_9ACTN|nr:hypothetical protein SSP24_03950 [Streptomyces spinoverrucosus]GHB40800.1 hypothetical protein GCM10010397_08650 [Streptomyces spinoverrucosus]